MPTAAPPGRRGSRPRRRGVSRVLYGRGRGGAHHLSGVQHDPLATRGGLRRWTALRASSLLLWRALRCAPSGFREAFLGGIGRAWLRPPCRAPLVGCPSPVSRSEDEHSVSRCPLGV